MKDKKDFNSTNGSEGKTQKLIQKKIPVRARVFFLFPKRPDWLWDPSNFLFKG
jgi:hypothetical protein